MGLRAILIPQTGVKHWRVSARLANRELAHLWWHRSPDVRYGEKFPEDTWVEMALEDIHWLMNARGFDLKIDRKVIA